MSDRVWPGSSAAHRPSHRHVSRRARTTALFAALVVAVLAPITAVASATSPSPYGQFTISGSQVSGTVTLTASSCAASKSAAEIQFIWFGGVKTLTGLTSKSILTIELNLKGSAYGRSGVLKTNGIQPPFLTFQAANPVIGWQSISGTFKTTANGASGSVKATLAHSLGNAKGHPTVTGTWQKCKPDPDS
jgi:hypothetical protein